MRAPAFWQSPEASLAARLLGPLGALYDLAGRERRRWVKPVRVSAPVICVGNLTLGGAGKTPLALSLAKNLLEAGHRVHFLTRGYKGRERGPLRVDPERHHAAQVGDEALLLARLAPCWVSVDRPAGALAAVASGAEVIVMDDGFQNPSLHQDLSILAIDGPVGLGNMRVFPAGPLRESWRHGLTRAHGVVLIGEDRTGLRARLGGGLVAAARLKAGPDAAALRGRRVVAFAGIGRPEKFFATLEEIGAHTVLAIPFADHHPYEEKEIGDLVDLAEREEAILVSTRKDAVRLPAAWVQKVRCLDVELAWASPADLDRLLAPVLNTHRPPG